MEDVQMLDAGLASMVYSTVTVFAVLFQLALAAGVPWGEFAMAGKFPGRLPLKVRIAAIIQAMLLVLFAMVVAARSGSYLPSWYESSQSYIWLVVFISASSLFLNLITPSKWERIIWAPVAAIMLWSSLSVSLYLRV